MRKEHIYAICMCVFVLPAAEDEWEESEVVNSTLGFYSLTGLKPGSQYYLVIKHGNSTQWEADSWTMGPGEPGLVHELSKVISKPSLKNSKCLLGTLHFQSILLMDVCIKKAAALRTHVAPHRFDNN